MVTKPPGTQLLGGIHGFKAQSWKTVSMRAAAWGVIFDEKVLKNSFKKLSSMTAEEILEVGKIWINDQDGTSKVARLKEPFCIDQGLQ